MIDINEERAASANNRKRGPPPGQKQFQERKEWTLTHPCLRPGYALNDSGYESISAGDLPAVLREVEGNERKQPSAEDIKLRLCNIG